MTSTMPSVSESRSDFPESRGMQSAIARVPSSTARSVTRVGHCALPIKSPVAPTPSQHHHGQGSLPQVEPIKLPDCEHAGNRGQAEERDRAEVVDEVIKDRQKHRCRQHATNGFG
jgi:hypothetical protein